ncbi:MAG: penicillin-binding protein 2 [Syntrophaceticus sp.]|nr:penicillin-binding protein 2 [Syntrophaceticus sp.]
MEQNTLHKIKVFQWLIILIFCVLILRLGYLQILNASAYQTKAEQNQFRMLPVFAPRGDILDQDGTVLAANKIVNTVSIIRHQTDEETLEHTIEKLAGLLSDLYPEIDAEYIQGLLDEQQVRLYEPVVIKRDIPIEVVARLEERREELPGVVIDQEMVRYYPEGPMASHILGHIGEASEEELEKDETYRQGDLTGKFGLEAQYEEYLRGKNGFRQVEVDANGRPVTDSDLRRVEPEQGNNLVLTLDNELQKTLEEAIDKSLKDLGKTAGAAVVLDVNTGAVLAMVSRPDFDPNNLVPPVSTKAVEEYLNPGAGKKPVMQNRAISSKYPPGSTFKPVTALAALESGNVKPSDAFYCRGVWSETNTKCTQSHGRVDLYRGMAASCNIYFIEAGRRAGIDMLAKYINEVGLDEKTGVDLPGEVSGSSSNPEKKKSIQLPILEKWYQDKQNKIEQKYAKLLKEAKTDQEKNDILFRKKDELRVLESEYQIKYDYEVEWSAHDTYILSFGQGANEYTPIGLANYVATIANGGKLMRPYLVQRVESPDGQVISEFGSHQVDQIDASQENLALVREAMKRVAQSGGTASGVFNGFPMQVGAKTGTAESGWGKEIYHGVFVAFAPADDPQIAFAGIIEEGYHGSTSAGPIARVVFEKYFGFDDVSSALIP